MIRLTSTGLNLSVSGPVVYLDNWAFIELAKKEPSRRRRFIEAVQSGVNVLFSVTNPAELSGPQGPSADAVKTFLDDIGPHWFPARLDPTEVVKLEIKGESPAKVCIDENFFKSYVADQMRPYTSDSGKVAEVSDDFFRLGALIKRLDPQRRSIRRTAAEFDELLKNKMSMVRERCKRDPAWLDQNFPLISFNPVRQLVSCTSTC